MTRVVDRNEELMCKVQIHGGSLDMDEKFNQLGVTTEKGKREME